MKCLRRASICGIAVIVLTFFVFATVGCGGCGCGSSASSNNAALSSLIVSAGALRPAFDPSTTDYTVPVGNAVTSTTVTPTGSATATITVNGVAVASGSTSAAIPLAVGATTVTISVTAQDGTTIRTYTVIVTRYASIDLIDPTPGAGDSFGSRVVVLGNGNIVVTDPFDSSVVAQGGAVHLYGPLSPTPIASIYGDVAMDQLGDRGLTILANNNFVVVTITDDEGGIVDAGSVRLVSGTTGAQIGPALAGDVASDALGSGGVVALPNNNYVVVSPADDVGGIVNTGSVRLVSGTTGMQIGATLAGDVLGDTLGGGGVTALANNNFVVNSPDDVEGGIVDAGSVRLVSGMTGAQIGPTLAGDVASDNLGIGGVTALANNNFVVASWSDDEGGIVDAGSVRLVSGTTGAQVGPTHAGDVTSDSLGSQGVTALSNSNFVVNSPFDDEGGIVDAGSVRLVSGTTGGQIGPALAGDVASDSLGITRATALANNNFVVATSSDDEGGIVNAGSVRLVNGTTGAQIGATLAGDMALDQLGGGVTALSNSNFVVASWLDDEGGVMDAGSVRLVSGTTGAQIGPTLAGDAASDNLGMDGVTAVANNNFVVASRNDDEGGIVDAGSVRLVSGTTGAQIGAPLAGDVLSDLLGAGGATALSNNNLVVSSPFDDEGGVVDAGSMRLVSGTTGAQIGPALVGATADDMSGGTVDKDSAFFVVAWPSWDNGPVDSGRVRLIAD